MDSRSYQAGERMKVGGKEKTEAFTKYVELYYMAGIIPDSEPTA